VGKAITQPGVYSKIPPIQDANFEKRYMEWNGDPNQVNRQKSKEIILYLHMLDGNLQTHCTQALDK
jgi:membrane protease subunit HflC